MSITKQNKTRIITMALLFTMIAAGTGAQVLVSVGVGAGGNYAIHSMEGVDDTYTHLGALVTGQVDMQFSRVLGLILWLDFYSDMSLKEREEDLTGKSTINYFGIAPTLKFCIPGSGFYFFAGPGVGIKTKGTLSYEYEGVKTEVDIPEIKSRLDVRIGAGYDFFLSGKLTLSPFAGINIGLNDVYPDTNWKINTVQAGAVLRFNLF